MALFGKRLNTGGGGDPAQRVAALEEHIRYMQEMLEFNARQTEKALAEMRSETEGVKAQISGLEQKKDEGGNENAGE